MTNRDVLLLIAGTFSLPTLIALSLAVSVALERGKEIECRVCGYLTGPMDGTRRIVCWARWQWHKLATGHHGWRRRWRRLPSVHIDDVIPR